MVKNRHGCATNNRHAYASQHHVCVKRNSYEHYDARLRLHDVHRVLHR